jgi:hypothetical protein
MGFFYWDSSVVVKRYIEEPGSAWVRLLAAHPDKEAHIVRLRQMAGRE